MRAGTPALLLLLAGCGQDAAPAPADVQTPAPVAAAPAAEAQHRIGTTSGLTGQTSALTGTISDFFVERTATETRVALAADTLFAFDKADLTPAAEANLRRTADLVREGGAGSVAIAGHTDSKGDDAYNLDLSRRRADAVAVWLKRQPGLDTRTFTTVGVGEAEPVAPNARPDGSDDPEARARNRRVVVTIPR